MTAVSKEQFKNHIRDYFQGLSQGMFFQNAYFGLGLLVLFLIYNPLMFACGFVASMIGYIYSTLNRTPRILKQYGLMTINGFFFGIAFASLFKTSFEFYFFLIVGALFLPLIVKSIFEILQHWKLSPFIAPYIVTIWLFCLCASGVNLYTNPLFGYVDSHILSAVFSNPHIGIQLLRALFVSIGQIFFISHPGFGFLLLVLVTLFNARAGLFLFLGTALATLVFYKISNGDLSWQQSFFSCSAGLLALGLAVMPEKYSWQTIMLFSVLSLFVTIALYHLLNQVSLPVLSLPYVLTIWVAILSRAPRLNISWASPRAPLE